MIVHQEIDKATFRLGDMMVVGMPDAKLVKALAVIADGLHRFYEMVPALAPGKSFVSCILSSLTVRDFLFKVGFHDAEVTPCMFAIRAMQGEELLHSLGIGDPDWRAARTEASKAKREQKGWPGHLVVKLPRHGYLIDTTLYQAKRPVWSDLPGMLAVPLIAPVNDSTEDLRFYGLDAISGMTIEDDVNNRTIDMLWLDQPKNKFWRDAPDGKNKLRRMGVTQALVDRFGKWEG